MSLADEARAELERRDAEEALAADAEHLQNDLRAFVDGAWKVLKSGDADKFLPNWHIDAICDHLTAVTRGELRFLQIWVPRGTMKSMLVSEIWPAWEWTTQPGLRYWTASYELGLAGRLAGYSLHIMKSGWYQARWGHVFELDKVGEKYYSNNKGGTRLTTAPGSTGLGEHGHRIIMDDLINALAAEATSRVTLEEISNWYDSTVEGSKADPKAAAEILIMQRLHEDDPAAHLYRQDPDAWTVLCLPERYEPAHPFAWKGDPRKEEGELLWPERRGEEESNRAAKRLGSHRAAGQMQQRPSAREGEILKRHWWRFYHPALFTDDRHKTRRPRFDVIVQSIDTPLKDKNANDRIAIQAWGVSGADRYLLDLKVGHMNYGQAKRAVLEQARHVRQQWRYVGHHVLIENAGYGVELYEELRRELTGCHKLSRAHEGDKVLRAESAAADLESGNCFLPGHRLAHDEMSMPDESRCSADINGFIDECAMFDNGRYDDQVDAWSQAMNWLRSRVIRKSRTFSSFKRKR